MAYPEKAVGEIWGYREKPYNAKCPIVPVEILQLGPPKSNRVRVRFRDGEFAGMDQWVARNGLRVPWDEVEGWLRDEKQYDQFARFSQVTSDDIAFQAAEQVYWLEELEGVRLELAARYGAILEIEDVSAFAAQFGLDVQALLDEPGAFVSRYGTFIGPWPLARRLAPIIAATFADKLLSTLRREEKKLEEEAVSGYYFKWSRNDERYIPPSVCAERLQEQQPMFALVREWCGVEPTTKFEELESLRQEVARLRDLVEEAAKALSSAGKQYEARTLRRKVLG